ncbi:hypothetical protein HDU98_011645 [Podochytrium sp. JEL0797]|nr:hypothetical protein HDU98_011645 [Podochytrium sp. JEL0797]
MLSRFSIAILPTTSYSRLALRGVPSSAVFRATTTSTVSTLASTPRRFVSDTPLAKQDNAINFERLLALGPSLRAAVPPLCEEHRAGVTALPKNDEVVKKLSELWHALTDTEKEARDPVSNSLSFYLFETEAKTSTETYFTTQTACTPQDKCLERTRCSLLTRLTPSKKRAKVEKNPDEPRCPETAYQLFLKDRGFLRKGAEGLKEGGAAWQAAIEEETQVYHVQAEKLKDVYEEQMDAYLETHDVTQFKKNDAAKFKEAKKEVPREPKIRVDPFHDFDATTTTRAAGHAEAASNQLKVDAASFAEIIHGRFFDSAVPLPDDFLPNRESRIMVAEIDDVKNRDTPFRFTLDSLSPHQQTAFNYLSNLPTMNTASTRDPVANNTIRAIITGTQVDIEPRETAKAFLQLLDAYGMPFSVFDKEFAAAAARAAATAGVAADAFVVVDNVQVDEMDEDLEEDGEEMEEDGEEMEVVGDVEDDEVEEEMEFEEDGEEMEPVLPLEQHGFKSIRAEFRYNAIRLVSPIAWSLKLEGRGAHVRKFPVQCFATLNDLAISDLEALLLPMKKILATSTWNLFAKQGNILKPHYANLESSQNLNASVTRAAAAIDSWISNNAKKLKSFDRQFASCNRHHLSQDGTIIFPLIKSSEKHTMQAAYFPLDGGSNNRILGHFLESDGIVENLDATNEKLMVPLIRLNTKALGLMHGGQTTRAVTVPLMYNIHVTSSQNYLLRLIKPPPIVFPSEERNKFLNLTPSELTITLGEDNDFVVRMPLKTVHMSTDTQEVTERWIDGRRLPKKAPFVRAEKSVSEKSYDSVVGMLKDLFERRKGLWEQLHAAYARRNRDLQKNIKANLAPISITLTRLIGTIKEDIDPKYRRRIDDLIKKLKLSGGDEALHTFFLEKQGHFQSPRIWFQMPKDPVLSPFKSWFGLLRLLGFRTPALARWRHRNCRRDIVFRLLLDLSTRFGIGRTRLTSFNGCATILSTSLDMSFVRKTLFTPHGSDTKEACESAAVRKVVVEKRHLQDAVSYEYKAAMEEQERLDDILDTLRKDAMICPRDGSEPVRYSVLIARLYKKNKEFSDSVIRDAARWNSGLDLYGTSSFNAGNSNLKRSKSGKPGIPGGKGKSGGKAAGKAGAKSRSSRAGLQFPVGRIHRLLRKGNYAQRVGAGAPVYLAAVLEYLGAEILELAGNAARDNKKTRIIPRHLQLAIRNDEELNKLLGNVTIAQGGVLPNIQPSLLPKKSDEDGHTGGKGGASQEF